MLEGKNILLGITGGIAAYKIVDLASRLTKEKANVKVIMTDNAQEFVTPLTYKSITHQSVITELFDIQAPVEHISLADWCDIIIIAPATANMIGKIANGLADDLLSTVVMATKAPKLISPSMNVNMYENQIVQDNINTLREKGYYIIPPDTGMLACGYEGKGKLPEPSEIMFFIKSFLHYKKDLLGRKILITCGACREHIDPVRYISNISSGKMGLSLARAAIHRGADVVLVHSYLEEKIPYYMRSEVSDKDYLIKSYLADNAEDMYHCVNNNLHRSDYVIMNAAVTDFKPHSTAKHKVKKESFSINEKESGFCLNLQPTVDILKQIYLNKKDHQSIIGFAAETDNLVNNARKKLSKCDCVIANNISVAGKDKTSVTIVEKQKENMTISGDKFEVAHRIIDIIIT